MHCPYAQLNSCSSNYLNMLKYWLVGYSHTETDNLLLIFVFLAHIIHRLQLFTSFTYSSIRSILLILVSNWILCIRSIIQCLIIPIVIWSQICLIFDDMRFLLVSLTSAVDFRWFRGGFPLIPLIPLQISADCESVLSAGRIF